VFFYLPTNFNSCEVLPAELRRYSACAEYLVHLIVRGRVLRRDDEDGWVPLKVAYLREVIPNRVVGKVRMALMNAGIIECDGRYIKGEKSMGYRLTSQYRVSARRAVCSDTRVAAKVAKVRGTNFRTDTRLPVHEHLLGWLRELNIDAREAKAIALSTPKLAENADVHLTTIAMIADGHVEFSHCRQGRVHSIVTRTARELRAALRIDGQRLVNVDIVNAQPLLVSLLLHNHTNRKEKGERGGSSTITMCKCDNYFENRYLQANADDARHYVDLCENGVFYEYVEKHAGVVGLSRSDLKKKVFRDVFFGRSQVVTDLTRFFAAEFPTIMGVIRSVKRRDYCDAGRTLQKIESGLMIHKVCRRLMLEHPAVPVITLHDSIMTTPENVELVRSVMAEEFERVGLHPKFKLESGCGAVAKAA
jgi:hypothetical protein